MKVYEIAEIIEKTAPKSLAYDRDNVGLLAGDKNRDVKKVYLTLDANLKTVSEAIKNNCDMIISHHPIFFSPVKKLEYGTPTGDLVRLLIENNIPLYAAHTNMDTAKGGINDKLAQMFNLSDIKVLEQHTDDVSAGLGRYGKLENEMSLCDFVETVKKVLNTPVRYTGDDDTKIHTVAIGSGACSELVPIAKEKGCEVLITADMKYHQMIDAYEMGICVIDAGHYPTEVCVMDIFDEILSGTDLKIIKSTNCDIFKYSV